MLHFYNALLYHCYQILSQLTFTLAPLVSLIFCGQLGTKELDAVSLAITVRTKATVYIKEIFYDTSRILWHF